MMRTMKEEVSPPQNSSATIVVHFTPLTLAPANLKRNGHVPNTQLNLLCHSSPPSNSVSVQWQPFETGNNLTSPFLLAYWFLLLLLFLFRIPSLTAQMFVEATLSKVMFCFVKWTCPARVPSLPPSWHIHKYLEVLVVGVVGLSMMSASKTSHRHTLLGKCSSYSAVPSV